MYTELGMKKNTNMDKHFYRVVHDKKYNNMNIKYNQAKSSQNI